MASSRDVAIASRQDVADTFLAAGLLPAKVDITTLWDTPFADTLKNLSL